MKAMRLGVVIMLLSLISCSGNKFRVDENLPQNQLNAITAVAASLNSSDEISSYEFVTSSFPLALEDEQFKGLRDALNKSLLDYQNCQKRGLQQAAEQQLVKIGHIQDQLKAIIAVNSETSEKYLVVLVKIEEKNRPNVATSIVAVFNEEGTQLVSKKEVITPVINTEAMLIEASNGNLRNIVFNDRGANNFLATQTTDPIAQFILSADAK